MSYFRKINVQAGKFADANKNTSSIKELRFANSHIRNFANRLVGRRGFEPLKSKDSGFTVRPIWPLWNLPFSLRVSIWLSDL
jgi:hypothetical protein